MALSLLLRFVTQSYNHRRRALTGRKKARDDSRNSFLISPFTNDFLPRWPIPWPTRSMAMRSKSVAYLCLSLWAHTHTTSSAGCVSSAAAPDLFEMYNGLSIIVVMGSDDHAYVTGKRRRTRHRLRQPRRKRQEKGKRDRTRRRKTFLRPAHRRVHNLMYRLTFAARRENSTRKKKVHQKQGYKNKEFLTFCVIK